MTNEEKARSIDFISNDFDRDAVFSECLRVLKIPNLIIFCSNRQLGKTITWFEQKGLSTTTLIWQKTNPIPSCRNSYISDVEYIVYVHGKGATFNNDTPLEYKYKVYTTPICPDGKLHPTQKSVTHIRRFLLLHSKENDVILDPFIGSGTTAVACVKERRNFIGFEKLKEYCDIANRRVKEEMKQGKLFDL